MATVPLPTFQELLRAYRVRAGLTQKELADQSGVSLNAISALERGVIRHPHKDTVRLLADTLALEPEERTTFAVVARAPVVVPAPAMSPLLNPAPVAAPKIGGKPKPDAAAPESTTKPALDGQVAQTPPLNPWSAEGGDHPAVGRPMEPQSVTSLPAVARRRPRGLAAGWVALVVLVLGSMAVWGPVAGSPAPTPMPVATSDSLAWYVVGGVQVEPLELGADGVPSAPVGRVVTATFRVRNAGHHVATLKGFGTGMRRPTNCANVWDGTAYDFPAVEQTITLQPGEDFLYQRSEVLTEPGSYFAEPLQLDNSYHWGGVQPYPRLWFRVTDPRMRQLPDRGCLPTIPTATPTP